jgi:hypothetical protein
VTYQYPQMQPQPPARRPKKVGLIIAGVAAGLLLCLCGGGVLAAVTSPDKPKKPANKPAAVESAQAAPPTAVPSLSPLPSPAGAEAAPPATTTTAHNNGGATATKTTTRTTKPATSKATEVYYANCAAVKAAGKAPLLRGQPGYRAGLDRDNDGVACET